MSWEEVEEAEDDFHQQWRFHYMVLFDAHRRSCLRMLAEDAVLAKDEMAGKLPENEESSSFDRTMDDSMVIGTVTADNPSISSGRDVGLHAGDETGKFFKYAKNVDVTKGRRGRISLLFEPGRIWVEYSPNLFPKGEPNPKVVADTSSLFDVISREGSELDKVLGELGIRREKRLNSVVEKVQRAHQKRAMAASGSAYADVMEIPACDVDIQASSKGVNLEAVEQEALDLATRDPISLNTQIRFSISQLSVGWKSAAEVLKLATANRGELVRQHDVDKAILQEQFEQEKVLQREQFKKEKVMQREQFKKEAAATKEDVDLALAGKYGEIVFPGDDTSPVAEQTPAPLVADDLTKEEVVHLRGKVIEMENALSRARDSINRTQQDKRFVDESDKFERQRSLLSLTLYFEVEVDSERGLKEAYLELLTERSIVPDPARMKFLAQETRNRHSRNAQRCSARAGVSSIWGGVGSLPDELDFCRGKGK
ncbi:hypothetical protein GIB67_008122 [Kingdonia uniflora]|uniref:Uncharacterized protein n=1 Tax=Kingdonia uniflora TaxID=39325 RepID=A0A7J7MT06_9MAGN|nr:hypothetical protein GIB67_008122 [Kingdonia uniflora]